MSPLIVHLTAEMKWTKVQPCAWCGEPLTRLVAEGSGREPGDPLPRPWPNGILVAIDPDSGDAFAWDPDGDPTSDEPRPASYCTPEADRNDRT